MNYCSVIVPAYNCEDTLKQTVKSILQSGMKISEVIIVNDGSSDCSLQVAYECAAEYNNIRIINQENMGVSAARNRGLQEATGDYIWFFDSDDLVDANSMVFATEIIDSIIPDMLVFGMSFDYYYGKKNYQKLELYYPQESLMSKQDVQEAFNELYYSNALSSACNKLFRRDVLNNNTIRFDPNLCEMEDFHFVLSVLQYCDSVYLIPQPLYHYYLQTKKSSSKNARNHNRVSGISNIVEYLDFFKPLLSNHLDILVSIFYMMLREKLATQNPKQIHITADRFCASPYSGNELLSFCDPGQKALASQLINHKYYSIYFQNIKSMIRKKLVGIIKRTWMYRRVFS